MDIFGNSTDEAAKPASPPLVIKSKQSPNGKIVFPYLKKAPVIKPKGLVLSGTYPAWISGNIYSKRDIVSLEGRNFISKADNNKNTPSTTAHDWKQVK